MTFEIEDEVPDVCPSCTGDMEDGQMVVEIGDEWFHDACVCKMTDKPKRDCPHCQERLRSEDAGQKAPFATPTQWRAAVAKVPSVPAKRETYCNPCRRKIYEGDMVSPNGEGLWVHTRCV